MKKPTIKRIIAYLIDIAIVTIIASSLTSVKFFNPYYEKYQAYQNKLETIMEENANNINELLNDDEIVDLSYDITRTGVFINIYTVALSFLYFVGFQYITKGKTLGKKLLKLEVVSNDKQDLRFVQLLKRSLIINSLVTSTIGIICILALSKNSYIGINKYVQLVEVTLILVSIGFVLYREDGRGLHDLFGNTRVISSDDKEFFMKHDEVKEAEIVEEKKEVKKRVTKKKEK